MSAMIQVENLGRYYGDIKAVDGLSFDVQRGEVLGFLGPNGAGKSTTMKMLTCFLAPSFGTAKVAGFDILEQSREVRSKIGYLPENAPLYGEMEVRDFLKFIVDVRGLESDRRAPAIQKAVELTSLGDVLDRKIETLSKGFRRRVGLAQALVHDPEILILDEPTDGLDPNQKHEVRNLIKLMAKEKSIILSTHILEEVEAVCTRAIIIARGKILADAVPGELKRRAASFGAVTLKFPDKLSSDALNSLNKISGVAKLEEQTSPSTGYSCRIFPKPGSELLASVLKETERLNLKIQDIQLDSGQLDEVFRQITK